MLRELITHSHKAAESTYKAKVAMETGMAVVKNIKDGTAEFPAADTGDNLFFVHKERIPTDINAARANMSDYDDDFNKVAADELVVLYSFDAGEQFATAAYDATLTDESIGKPLVAGTDGKLKLAESKATSKYVFTGLYNDAGHTLCGVEVMNDPITVA